MEKNSNVDVQVGSSPKAKVVEAPQPKVTSVEESWYIPEEGEIVEMIEGIETHIKLIGGEEFTRLADECIPPVTNPKQQPKMDRSKYMRLLIETCVLKPKFIYSRLKPNVITALVTRLEDLMGLSELAQKNSDTR